MSIGRSPLENPDYHEEIVHESNEAIVKATLKASGWDFETKRAVAGRSGYWSLHFRRRSSSQEVETK
jgi:hypothetical protein